jgi:hypothetical protein
MITYKSGDVINAVKGFKKHILVLNVVNDINKWGSGFVLSISDKWPHIKHDYNSYCASIDKNELLGKNQYVKANEFITVVNMFAQTGIYWNNGQPPIRYNALAECLTEITKTIPKSFEIHTPYIGMGRAGGDPKIIIPMIESILSDYSVFLYEYKNDTDLSEKLKIRMSN